MKEETHDLFNLSKLPKAKAQEIKTIFLFLSSDTGSSSSPKPSKPMSRTMIYQSGDTALLPCDISVPKAESGNGGQNVQDELVLIMWYREDVKSPIYSIGKREREGRWDN